VQSFRNSKPILAGEEPNPLEPSGVMRWYVVGTGRKAVLVREHAVAQFSHGQDGHRFRVAFGVSEDGVRVSEFTMMAGWGESITARSLQQVKPGDIIRFAFEEVSRPLTDDGQVATGFSGIAASEATTVMVKKPRGRPASVPADEYKLAADAYRDAQRRGASTTAAVKDALGVSASTARKRVMGARERGLLPPAKSTRPKLAEDPR